MNAKKKETEYEEQLKKFAENKNDVCRVGKKTYKVGETWKEKGKCEVLACHPGGLVSVMPCPRFLYDKKKPRPDCKIVPEDPDIDEYPDCCEYIYCSRPAPG